MLEALPPMGILLLDPDVKEAGLLWCEDDARSFRSEAKSMTTLEAPEGSTAPIAPPPRVTFAEQAGAPPTAPSCWSALTAAVEDSEEDEDEEEEEWESPEIGD